MKKTQKEIEAQIAEIHELFGTTQEAIDKVNNYFKTPVISTPTKSQKLNPNQNQEDNE